MLSRAGERQTVGASGRPRRMWPSRRPSAGGPRPPSSGSRSGSRRPERPELAWARRADLERALDALLENALRYSPGGHRGDDRQRRRERSRCATADPGLAPRSARSCSSASAAAGPGAPDRPAAGSASRSRASWPANGAATCRSPIAPAAERRPGCRCPPARTRSPESPPLPVLNRPVASVRCHDPPGRAHHASPRCSASSPPRRSPGRRVSWPVSASDCPRSRCRWPATSLRRSRSPSARSRRPTARHAGRSAVPRRRGAGRHRRRRRRSLLPTAAPPLPRHRRRRAPHRRPRHRRPVRRGHRPVRRPPVVRTTVAARAVVAARTVVAARAVADAMTDRAAAMTDRPRQG